MASFDVAKASNPQRFSPRKLYFSPICASFSLKSFPLYGSFDYMMYILYSLFHHLHVCALIGPSDPVQPTSLRATGTSFNGTTIHWTVTRIAYTPETYTVHFGTSPGSLTNVSQQRPSGDDFTATNLSFSVQLTGLTPGTDYSYRVVATNTVGRTAMSVIGMFRTLDVRKCDPCVAISINLPLNCSHYFSAIIQLPLVLFRTLWQSQWLVSRQC